MQFPKRSYLILGLLLTVSWASAQDNERLSISAKTASLEKTTGYFNYYWDNNAGKIWLEIPKDRQDFLYVNSLSAGVGSNDIGLDRGQLGDTRIVRFEAVGDKILMQQPNLRYRANSTNEKEVQAVAEAFASSVLWGFKIEAEDDNAYLIDLTPLLLSDAHQVVQTLKSNKQGNYKLDPTRSAPYLPRTKNFPKNSEFEATLTFTGQPEGKYIRDVTPTPSAVTVRMHHSFIELPDDNFTPRAFDPRSGYFFIEYADYATPINEPLAKKWIAKHRLEKKNPELPQSEAVEPIIYYIDPGTPEPVKSALMEGAQWWNQAFEAAGYINAFQIKELPEGADLLDVRYNVIQWVHRATRGWSYGASVTDPRTGEIIKGHVSLGSLRVRQDYLIAQGLLSVFDDPEGDDSPLFELALARLRQLSAHEVGHTLGLAHNFAASYNDRASVMDYPHPWASINEDGDIDLSEAYAVGIGDWDKRTILYGYQDFPSGTNETTQLNNILAENTQQGLIYISDRDARPMGGSHPHGHLWDNGSSPSADLERIMEVRKTAMGYFGAGTIPDGTPWAELERVLVPLYFSHRYAVEATAKVVGGHNYSYAVKGESEWQNHPVSPTDQERALNALLETLSPTSLAIPNRITELIPPQPMGYNRDRELFKTYTGGFAFDPLAAAESAANHTLRLLLHPHRLTRILEQHALYNSHISLNAYLDQILTQAFLAERQNQLARELAWTVEKLIVIHLIHLSNAKGQQAQVTAICQFALDGLFKQLKVELNATKDEAQKAHYFYLRSLIEQSKTDYEDLELPKALPMPPGSPIGCGG